MPTTLLKLKSTLNAFMPPLGVDGEKAFHHFSIEELMAALPDAVRDQIKQAADEMVQSMPPMPGITPFVRGVLVNQAHKMAVEFALFGHKLGYDQAVWEANEGVA